MVTRNRYRTDCAPSINSDQATNTCRWCPWTWTSYCGNARRTDQTAFEVMPVNRVLMSGIIVRVPCAPLSFTLIQLVWESNIMFFPDHSWIYIVTDHYFSWNVIFLSWLLLDKKDYPLLGSFDRFFCKISV